MLKRLLIRLTWSLLTLLGTAVLTFILINTVPADVARVIAGPKASPEVLDQIRENYHLKDPLLKAPRFLLGANWPKVTSVSLSSPINPSLKRS
jgi:ABC-type dipeptide/oligopeptide/nickel transport system permease component